jgi:hypothetical protein
LRFYSKVYIAKAKAPKKRKSGPIRKTTETYSELSRLSKRKSGAIKIDLIDGIEAFKKEIPVTELATAWSTGNYEKIMALIPWQTLPSNLSAALAGITDATAAAANVQIEALPPNINKNLRFDLSNPRIRTFIDQRSAALVTGIQADAQKTIQDAVARSFSEALTPNLVAEQIKSSIGLLPAHERALAKYREGLVAEKIPPAQVEDLADSYEERLLDYRATLIARTETRAAINNGQLAVWSEGVNQGFINHQNARKEWFVDGDPCLVCDPMDGKQVGLDEAWIITYPGGETKAVQVPSESHPQCLCGMELHFIENEEPNADETAD